MSDEQKASHHSAANDPSYPAIPDSEDFDRYGVWVKAGPEDVEEGAAATGTDEAPDFDLDDLSEDEFAPSDADTLLTDEEEDALADLESDFSTVEDAGESEFDLGDFESLEEELESEEEIGSQEEPAEMPLELDGEVLSMDSQPPGGEEAAAQPEPGPAETGGLEPVEETGGLETIEENELDEQNEVSDDILGADFDLEEDIDSQLEDLALDLGEETPAEPTGAPSASGGDQEELEDIEDLSLEDLDALDVDLEAEEHEDRTPEAGEHEHAEAAREPGAETAPGPTESSRTDEDEIDLESIPGEEPFEDFDFEEDEDITEELPELSGEDEEEETPLPVVEDDEETIDEELASVLDEEEPAEAAGPVLSEFQQQGQPEDQTTDIEDVMATDGYSSGDERDESSVLVNIEKELLAIKNELNELKQELATLRSGGGPEQQRSSREEGSEDMEVSLGSPAGEKGGFFEEEEDEDETIALTGDELDHILDTAEFTEQRGQPTEYDDLDLRLDDSLSPEASGDELETGEENAESGASTATEETGAPIEEITLEDMTGESALEELEPEEVEAEAGSNELEELDLELGGEEETPAPQELHSSEQGHLDALAEFDVDAELADIEELSDEPNGESEKPDTSEIDSIEIELPDDEQPVGESGFAGADTEVEDFESELGEPVLEIPEEGEDEVEDLGDFDFGLEEQEAEAEPQPEPAEPFESAHPTRPQQAGAGVSSPGSGAGELPENLKQEIRSVLSYMDQLLESLPEEKIQEFARSEHFEVYKRLFEELGLESE